MEAGSEDMQANNKSVEKLMDEYLKSKGFYRKKIAKDGSCLFRAVAEQVLHCQSRHTEVRATCVDFLKKNRTKYELFIEGNFEEYLHRLEDPQNWVGEVEISALAVIYRHDFIIFQEPGKPPVNITENSFTDKVRLCFLNGNHYDSVYPLEFIEKAALCQSILYELLYERVYKVDHSVVASCLGRRGDPEDESGECKSSDESDLEEDEAFWTNETAGPSNMNNRRLPTSNQPCKTAKSHPPRFSLSPRVQLSLNPSIFRNVEYDVWLRSKRAQQKRDFCIAAGMQYTVGDKCKVRLDNTGKFYSAYIQAVHPDNGPVTVFIEELGDKHSIPLWNLRPSSGDNESWSTVAERGKKLSLVNGNGHHFERDTRGGRKSGKGPGPHAPAGTGRMQKQHLWPPQAPAQEEATGRAAHATARKSESGASSTPVFGLSVDERLAREEEEKSQALLEIMHRDEKGFPALGSQGVSRASAQPGDGGRRSQNSERRGSRKKGELQEVSREGDGKDPSLRSGHRVEQTKHLNKRAGQLEPRLSPSADHNPTVQRPIPKQETPAKPSSSPGLHNVDRESPPEPTRPAVPTSTPAAAPPTSASATAAPAGSAPTSASATAAPAGSAPTSASATAAPAGSAPTSASATAAPAGSAPTSASAKAAPAVPAQASATAAPAVSAPASALTTAASTPAIPAPVSTVPASAPVLSTPKSTETAPISTASVAILPSPAPSVSTPPTCSSAAPTSTVSAPVLPVPATASPAPVLSVPVSASPTPFLLAHTSAAPAPPLPVPSFAPPTPSPVPMTPVIPPPVVPNPSLQQNPAGPLPYEGVNSNPRGVMPQLGVGPGPATPPVLPEHLSNPHAPSPSVPPTGPLPFHQISNLYQDPLYPGFPVNDKDEVAATPPFSYARNGQDLPREMNVLRFFFNLGVKAYTHLVWPPHTYIYPLLQAHMNARAMQPKLPSTAPYMTPWYSDTPPPAPVLHMNSVPSGAMTMQEGYGHAPSYGHAPGPGGRIPGQFEHAHCPVPPGVGVGIGMVGGALGPQHMDLGLSSDGRPALGYSPQPAAPLPSLMGPPPWTGPRPNAFPGPFSSCPPPPPPSQYLPPPQYPPITLGYSAPRMSIPTPGIVPQVKSSDSPAGKGGQTVTEGPAGISSLALQREPGKEKRVATPLTGLPPLVSVPAEPAPPLVDLKAQGGSDAGSKLGQGHTAAGVQDAGRPATPTTERIMVSFKEELRSGVLSLAPTNENTGEDGVTTPRGGSKESPSQGAESGTEPSSEPQVYHTTYSPREVWEEEGEASEADLRSSRSYYRSSRGRRAYDDGRAYRDTRWRGDGRGFRGRRGPDDRRDYTYRRPLEGGPSYPANFKGRNGRGRGQGHSPYTNGREGGYTAVTQRNTTYADV